MTQRLSSETQPGYLKLVTSDWLKGLVVTIIAAALVSLQSALSGDANMIFTVPFWQEVMKVALTAGIAYLIKNLSTNKEEQFAGIPATAPKK